MSEERKLVVVTCAQKLMQCGLSNARPWHTGDGRFCKRGDRACL